MGDYSGVSFFALYSFARQLQNDPGKIESIDIIPQITTASGDISTIYGELRPLFIFFNALQKNAADWAIPGQVDPLFTYTSDITQMGLEFSINVHVQPGLAGIPFQIQLKLPDHAIISNPANGWRSDSIRIWTWQGFLYQRSKLELTFEIKP
jgi:hypothetical protein